MVLLARLRCLPACRVATVKTLSQVDLEFVVEIVGEVVPHERTWLSVAVCGTANGCHKSHGEAKF
mgnify:CR=1 FL=1